MAASKLLSLLDETIAMVQKYDFSPNGGHAVKEQVEWPAARVRQTFVDYFVEKRGHTHWPSAPVVPKADPTLLFINSGMCQFKPIFLGDIQDGDDLAKLVRAANTQKCIRAGGKHNDLDDTGRDVYHHTFFEMLGNWSFGDYFKEEAIDWAWDLLTNVYKLEPDRLYATYFQGDEAMRVPVDEEARKLWGKYLPPERILPFDAKDNFWQMADTGPCGPCTEIHYDRIGGRDASALVNMDDPNVLEIWNLVFMQFNRSDDGSLAELPRKHIDTGMGFERLTSVLQNKMSNYDTDVFTPILEEIRKVTGARPYSGKVGTEDKDEVDTAYRVVADHIRTLCFSIADGAQPSSEGRNYVVRRILRRAVRYGRQTLGADSGFFTQLVDVVVREFGDAFPELRAKQEKIKATISEEERLFDKTWTHGEKLFNKLKDKVLADGDKFIKGKDAFKLYDTFGFPVDLTQIMAEAAGLQVDMEGYKAALDKARKDSRKAKGSARLQFADKERLHLQSLGVAPTDSEPKYTWKEIGVNVAALYHVDKREFVDQADVEDNDVAVVLDRTSFYAESGGQVADHGNIADASQENVFSVTDVTEVAGYVLHIGRVLSGTVRVGTPMRAEVDYPRRKKIAPNHTMTHVLNLALRKTLGMECNQKGSHVDETRTRFDFGHSKPMTAAELTKCESLVQEAIEQQLAVHTKVVPYKQATGITALRAMFDERYPEMVRVVTIGPTVEEVLQAPTAERWMDVSVELCGGTHLANTGEAGGFAVLSEESVAGGVRRIVAVTGEEAREAAELAQTIAGEFAGAAQLSAGAALTRECHRLSNRLSEARISLPEKAKLQKQLQVLNGKDKAWKKKHRKALAAQASALGKERAAKALADGAKFVVVELPDGSDQAAAKACIKQFNKVAKQVPVMVFAPDSAHGVSLARAAVPKTSPADGVLDAKAWIEHVAPLLDGKGGGAAASAQAQGKSVERVPEAVRAAESFAEQTLA